MHRAEYAYKAIELSTGVRNDSWGDPSIQHARIALAWSAILNREVTAQQVALCMAAMKLVRAAGNPDIVDSYIDAIAYVGIAGEIIDAQRL